MRSMLWFVLAMAMNVLALDMMVYYADVLSAAVLVSLVFVSFAMALWRAEYPCSTSLRGNVQKEKQMTNVQLVQRWLLVERVLLVMAIVMVVLSYALWVYGAWLWIDGDWSTQPTLVLVGIAGFTVAIAFAECSTKAMLKAIEYECGIERSAKSSKLPLYASDVEMAAWDERIKALAAKREGK